MRPSYHLHVLGLLGVGLMSRGVAAADPPASEANSASKTSAAARVVESTQAAAPKAQATTEEKKESAAGGGGYSWRDRPRPSRRTKRVRIDSNRPLAMAPSFQLLADGSSRVTLLVSRPTQVVRRQDGQRLVFFLQNAQVGIHNNTNPLVTLHFPTALARTKLVRHKAGVELLLELRDDVAARHIIRAGPAESMVLEILIPRPVKKYAEPTIAAKQPPPRDNRPVN